MKKRDMLLIGILIITAVLIFLGSFLFKRQGSSVVISKDNKVIYELSLFENHIIELDGNRLEIKDGVVDMTDASCKNQVCVNHPAISKKGESITCLPHKLIVEIK